MQLFGVLTCLTVIGLILAARRFGGAVEKRAGQRGGGMRQLRRGRPQRLWGDASQVHLLLWLFMSADALVRTPGKLFYVNVFTDFVVAGESRD